MIPIQSISPELAQQLGSEPIDFVAKAKYKYPRSGNWTTLAGGLFLCLFVSVFWAAFILPVLYSDGTNVTINKVDQFVSRDNLGPMLPAFLIILVFTVIALSIIGYAIYKMVAPGGYFIGTSKHLVSYIGNQTTFTEWHQFTGSMEIVQKEDRGSLILELNGAKRQKENNIQAYVPEQIDIVRIEGVYHVFSVCRARIEQAQSSSNGALSIENAKENEDKSAWF